MDEFVCPPDHKHGETSNCYCLHKCRCGDCREHQREYEFWRRAMVKRGRVLLIDATGTRRRIQALAALGWGAAMVGARYGIQKGTINNWGARTGTVQRSTAETVRRIYDDLSMQLPPTDTRSERVRVGNTKARARKSGWVPPLAWDEETIDDPNATPFVAVEDGFLHRLDDVVVDAAVRGERPVMSPAERRAAVTRLNTRKWSAPRIAEFIGCNTKTVERIREELHLPIPTDDEIREAA